jgi:hypothetical protein
MQADCSWVADGRQGMQPDCQAGPGGEGSVRRLAVRDRRWTGLDSVLNVLVQPAPYAVGLHLSLPISGQFSPSAGRRLWWRRGSKAIWQHSTALSLALVVGKCLTPSY